MEVKWESNSKVKKLAAMGVIEMKNVIPRTSTANFPAECATVRMQQISHNSPWVTIHIKGENKKQMHHWGTGIYAKTMRVSFGLDYTGDTVNGELCGDLDFSDVNAAVNQVKEVLKSC